MYTLIGVDGNAFAIMGYTSKAMKECGFTQEDIRDMQADAMSDSYYHLINVCATWIDKCNNKVEV